MTRSLMASAASLSMMMGVASAQTTTIQTTTTTVPSYTTTTTVPAFVDPAGTVTSFTTTVPAVVAPMVAVDATTTENSLNPDGSKTRTIERVHRDGVGVATGTSSSQTTYPYSRMVTTRTTETALNPDGTRTQTVNTDFGFPNGTPLNHSTVTTILPPTDAATMTIQRTTTTNAQ